MSVNEIWYQEIAYLKEHLKRLGFELEETKSIFPKINGVIFVPIQPPNALTGIKYNDYENIPYCLRMDHKTICYMSTSDNYFDILLSPSISSFKYRPVMNTNVVPFTNFTNDRIIDYEITYDTFLSYSKEQIEKLIKKFKHKRLYYFAS